ncbi:MAG TPA: transporter substrate-binding domain-containing protein, partial [Burkholderiaceae bacterium]
ARIGCKIEVVEMSRLRIFQSLQHGEYIDLATSTSQTPERDRYAQFVPLAVTRNYLLVHKRVAAPGFDLNQFVAQPRLTMGVLAGSNYGSFINARLAVLERLGRTQTATQVEQLLPRLLAGRYDGLVVTPAYFIAALRELPGGEDIRVVPIPESDAYQAGFYLSRTTLSDARREPLRKALEAIHQDGTLLRTYRKYFPDALARERVTFGPLAK